MFILNKNAPAYSTYIDRYFTSNRLATRYSQQLPKAKAITTEKLDEEPNN